MLQENRLPKKKKRVSICVFAVNLRRQLPKVEPQVLRGLPKSRPTRYEALLKVNTIRVIQTYVRKYCSNYQSINNVDFCPVFPLMVESG